MKLLIASIAALGLMTVSASALTFNPAQFIGIDRDVDNRISADEANNYRLRYFKALDQNGDGSVEFEEYVQANKLRSPVQEKDAKVDMPDEYKMADANSDTVLTLEEFLEDGRKKFKVLDKDGDGYVSRDEFVAPGL